MMESQVIDGIRGKKKKKRLTRSPAITLRENDFPRENFYNITG